MALEEIEIIYRENLTTCSNFHLKFPFLILILSFMSSMTAGYSEKRVSVLEDFLITILEVQLETMML